MSRKISHASSATEMPLRESYGRLLAPYACFSEESRGRRIAEVHHSDRPEFQRDRDRIIHSTAFRRLEYKTQVFVNHEGDHYRTRLTHSLEVAQLSRSIARELHVDEDLAESIALAHDLGHTPFGHAGEDALHEVMAPFGGFDHNAQTLHILTKLEAKYAAYDGLNLTWECLEGVAKHNGPLTGALAVSKEPLPRMIADYVKIHDLELHSFASLEAQISALSDDIAYNNHDIEDGIRAGLFTPEQVKALPVIGEIVTSIQKEYPGLSEDRLIHELKRQMIGRMVSDLVRTTRMNLLESGVQSAKEVRAQKRPLVAFSNEMHMHHMAIKAFLNEHMYKHYKVNRMTSKARRIVKELFEFFLAEPECLPTSWQKKTSGAHTQETAECVADYIAGMTDRYATDLHRKVFDVSYRMIGDKA